ncbi:hypothetical protein PCASD_11393 [Puccinia coronata f. sp. avenae]|uniref:Transcription factor CBF/NF-Y/archaeal histone domain-containing protein n=1 Tax=Puccinia coronata f. sp. avenae TaxID=200324 RepID=A0A2N5TDM7_9BASI|nr:hypothetical protein PCASD_11393 [Puccinia coronata f. sp. avenae]
MGKKLDGCLPAEPSDGDGGADPPKLNGAFRRDAHPPTSELIPGVNSFEPTPDWPDTPSPSSSSPFPTATATLSAESLLALSRSIIMKKKGGSSRFPVARIKKIMQADEDVGKVAQATPLLVSKAVELFMQSLVEAAVLEAERRGSRKVQAYHLKQAIQITPAFDFLKDIVAKIPDPLHGGAEEQESSTDPRKRSAGKHKEEDDDEAMAEDGEESGLGGADDDEEYY